MRPFKSTIAVNPEAGQGVAIITAGLPVSSRDTTCRAVIRQGRPSSTSQQSKSTSISMARRQNVKEFIIFTLVKILDKAMIRHLVKLRKASIPVRPDMIKISDFLLII
jgi:hypothetical protein